MWGKSFILQKGGMLNVNFVNFVNIRSNEKAAAAANYSNRSLNTWILYETDFLTHRFYQLQLDGFVIVLIVDDTPQIRLSND